MDWLPPFLGTLFLVVGLCMIVSRTRVPARQFVHPSRVSMSECFRCSNCGVNWPRMVEFANCPECQQACSVMASSPELTVREAIVKKAYADFSRYCVKHDARQAEQAIEEHSKAIARLPEIER